MFFVLRTHVTSLLCKFGIRFGALCSHVWLIVGATSGFPGFQIISPQLRRRGSSKYCKPSAFFMIFPPKLLFRPTYIPRILRYEQRENLIKTTKIGRFALNYCIVKFLLACCLFFPKNNGGLKMDFVECRCRNQNSEINTSIYIWASFCRTGKMSVLCHFVFNKVASSV